MPYKNTIKKKKSYLVKIIPSFLFIFLVELILKLYFPIRLTGYIENYEYHPLLGTVLKKGYFTKSTDYKQEIFVNEYGAINTQINFDKYEKIAFALGDSYTQGTGGSLSASYPTIADLLINSKSGIYHPKIGVVNLGTAANGGLQNIEIYKIFKSKIKTPEYVFYLGCDNDYLDDLRFKNGLKHKHIVDGNPIYSFWVRPLQLFSKLEIVKRLKVARNKIIEKQITGLNITKQNNNIKSICESTAEKSETVLKELHKISKKDNFQLIISWVENPTSNSKCSSYEWLKNWAKKNDVKFADYLPMVYSTKNYLENMPFTYDHSGSHFRTWVNFIIAKSFIEHIN